MISAIVLAAGESKRMGRTKQLLEWKGKILLQHVLDHFLGSRADEVILVLGHEADRILEKLRTERARVILNPDHREGMSASIRKGLMALDRRSEGFLIALGDQPEIDEEIINRLISEFRNICPNRNIVLPAFRGSRGHPVLFSRKYVDEALGLKGDVGCRQILASHPEDILEVEMNTGAIRLDIDTPQQYGEHGKR